MILKQEGQVLPFRPGTWCMVTEEWIQNKLFALYQSEQWGDTVPNIVISADGEICFETFDDLETAVKEYLEEDELIEILLLCVNRRQV